jgi:hypothetical protein
VWQREEEKKKKKKEKRHVSSTRKIENDTGDKTA